MSESIAKIGLSGMQAALGRIAHHAADLTTSFIRDDGDAVTAIVGLKLDEHAYQASAQVVKVQQRLDDAVLDILA